MREPVNRLRQMRVDAGWSQAQLIAAMRRVARDLKVALPEPESLKTNVRRWENARVAPGPEYRKVLRIVYSCYLLEALARETQSARTLAEPHPPGRCGPSPRRPPGGRTDCGAITGSTSPGSPPRTRQPATSTMPAWPAATR
jgi:hypothetical protein